MEIKPIYVTSMGMFWDINEASNKANRAKVTEGSRPGDTMVREVVREKFVLIHDGRIFSLSEVEIDVK
jgi:hypothetical protein